MTYNESRLLEMASRLRKGDFVQGEDMDDIWTVGKVQYKTNDDVVVLDRFDREHTLVRDETYKASRNIFEKWNEGVDISELNGFGPAPTTTPQEVIRDLQESTKVVPAADLGGIPIRAEGTEAKGDPKEDQGNTPGSNTQVESEDDQNLESTPKVRIRPKLDRYVTHKEAKTAGGRRKVDNNDEVAGLLRDCTTPDETFEKVAEALKYLDPENARTPDEMRAKYGHLNPGQQRMCAGNLVRGAMKRAGVSTLDAIRP